MSTIFVLLAQTQSTTTAAPSTVIALWLAGASAFLVSYKIADLGIIVRRARRKAEAIVELTAPVSRIWEVREKPSGEVGEVKRLDRVQESLALLSQIDLEGYLSDETTRDLIDQTLMIFHSDFFRSSERG